MRPLAISATKKKNQASMTVVRYFISGLQQANHTAHFILTICANSKSRHNYIHHTPTLLATYTHTHEQSNDKHKDNNNDFNNTDSSDAKIMKTSQKWWASEPSSAAGPGYDLPCTLYGHWHTTGPSNSSFIYICPHLSRQQINDYSMAPNRAIFSINILISDTSSK